MRSKWWYLRHICTGPVDCADEGECECSMVLSYAEKWEVSAATEQKHRAVVVVNLLNSMVSEDNQAKNDNMGNNHPKKKKKRLNFGGPDMCSSDHSHRLLHMVYMCAEWQEESERWSYIRGIYCIYCVTGHFVTVERSRYACAHDCILVTLTSPTEGVNRTAFHLYSTVIFGLKF